MFYFITSRQDMLTSAIELAQAQRLKIFDHLKATCQNHHLRVQPRPL